MQDKQPSPKSLFTPYAIVLGVIALLTSLYLSHYFKTRQENPDLELMTGILYPSDYRPLKEFELVNQNNQTFTKSDLADVWSLVFFGYTYCPDVCPLTMSLMQQIKASLAKHNASKNLQIILISIDPKRDTPARLKEYATYFDPAFIALTGSELQMQNISKSFGVFYSQAPQTDSSTNYVLDHSAGIFLVNPKARLSALFSAPHNVDDIVHDYLTIYNQNS